MGDEEEAPPKYVYEGDRAPGAVVSVTAGEGKTKTEDVTLLGAREGVGKATYPNGDTFDGEYVGGAREGLGTYTYSAPPPEEGEDPAPPIAVYEGKWSGGGRSGVGTLSFASGAKYQGSFAAGKYQGQGTMFYANGDIYTGAWRGGKKHGIGTYIYKASGAKAIGEWGENTLLHGKFVDTFGNTYAGNFSGDASGAAFVAGGSFSLCSGASATVPKPTKAELLKEIAAFDRDGNGLIDVAELKAVLTRPGTGTPAMDEAEAAVFLELFTELFDKNSDGKLSVSELTNALESQFTGLM